MADFGVCLRIVRLEHALDLPLPRQASSGSAGIDLRAAVGEKVTIAPGQRATVPTGLVLEIPAGWEGQVRPRSGLAANHGVTLTNSPGTIDSDYRGEVKVLMINLGEAPFVVERSDRIAQLILSPVPVVEVVEVGAAEDTDRGDGGFGSTGVK